MQAAIYLYHINDKNTLKNIQFIAVRLGCKVKAITEEMVGQKVGYIAGLDGFSEEVSQQDYKIPVDPVMVLKGFTDQKLDVLLAGMRKAGIPKINLKAMLTEVNQNWYFYELYEELIREHREFNKP